MALRSMTVHRYEEIRRRLAEGRGLREIARALGCSRRTVREVRDGERLSPDAPKSTSDPLWMTQLDWPAIIHDLGLGHPLKFLWEEKAQNLTTYSNFWKQFYRKFPQYREASITAREFAPGERVEVDYAGEPLEWIELKSGEIRKAWVFVAGLGFSQLLFAWAAEDMKSRNWLGSHRRMFAYYGGVAHVTVPDCLKQGVLKCHLYDPDLNPGYAELERINDRRHTRFGVSRRERFETVEKAALKPLPIGAVDCGEWKDATLHADCYLYIDGDYYSAPHIHRHKRLRVKITENQVEIFLALERLAIHPRSRYRTGRRIKIDAHFPPASQAYYEATPQKLLSQSRFIHPELNRLFVELFNADVYGNIRRCQGFVRRCTKEINQSGHELASERIAAAIASMRRYNKFRVPYFQALLDQARKQALKPDAGREIERRPGNPMLRYVAAASVGENASVPSPSTQESLDL